MYLWQQFRVFSFALFVVVSNGAAIPAARTAPERTHQTPAEEHEGRHKKLKKYAMLAGVGAATGGIGAIILGGGVATGAASGAGEHILFHNLREKWKHRHDENGHTKSDQK